jgi:hypothetical protein
MAAHDAGKPASLLLAYHWPIFIQLRLFMPGPTDRLDKVILEARRAAD